MRADRATHKPVAQTRDRTRDGEEQDVLDPDGVDGCVGRVAQSDAQGGSHPDTLRAGAALPRLD